MIIRKKARRYKYKEIDNKKKDFRRYKCKEIDFISNNL